MLRKVLCNALALAVMTAASASEALTFDCWKLDSGKLAEARSMGLCNDVFATMKPPTPPPPSEAKRARSKVERAEAPRSSPSAERAAPTDLGQQFRTDVDALGRLLGDIFTDGRRGSSSWKGSAKPREYEYDLP